MKNTDTKVHTDVQPNINKTFGHRCQKQSRIKFVRGESVRKERKMIPDQGRTVLRIHWTMQSVRYGHDKSFVIDTLSNCTSVQMRICQMEWHTVANLAPPQ